MENNRLCITENKRANAWKNLQYSLCDQRRFRSAFASAQSDQRLRWSQLPSTAPDYLNRDKWEPLPFWVGVHVNQNLCWSHRTFCRLCRALAQIVDAMSRIHSIVSNYSDSGQQMPWSDCADAQADRAFSVHICSKTRFRMARPK